MPIFPVPISYTANEFVLTAASPLLLKLPSAPECHFLVYVMNTNGDSGKVTFERVVGPIQNSPGSVSDPSSKCRPHAPGTLAIEEENRQW